MNTKEKEKNRKRKKETTYLGEADGIKSMAI